MGDFVIDADGEKLRVTLVEAGFRVDRWCRGDDAHGPHWDRLPELQPSEVAAVSYGKRAVAS